jgi:hypothetical protein
MRVVLLVEVVVAGYGFDAGANPVLNFDDDARIRLCLCFECQIREEKAIPKTPV